MVRKDLIYEGITTYNVCWQTSKNLPSERTWFTKGLRRQSITEILYDLHSQKGPDLRRDYDRMDHKG